MEEEPEYEKKLNRISDKILAYVLGGYTGYEAVQRHTEIVHDIAVFRNWWNEQNQGGKQ